MTNDCVMVTGAAGLLGTAIARDLSRNYQVFGMDIAVPDDPVPNVRYQEMDVTSDESVAAALREVHAQCGGRLTSVIHLAAYYDFSGEPSRKYEEVTVRGTQRLLQHLHQFELAQFVFSSTMLVHRPAPPPAEITEEDPLGAQWDYPKSKIAAENVIREYRGSVPAVLLRIAGVYSDRCDSIPLAQQIRRIAEKRITSHVFPGDTSRGQSFVHIEDLTAAVRLIVERRQSLAEVETLLLGEEETYSYDQIQRTLGRLIHGDDDWTTRKIPKVMAKAGAVVQGAFDSGPGGEFIKPWMIDMADDHYDLDVSRASQKLGWQPRHRLIDTLPYMVGSLKSDPAAWYAHHGLGEPEPEVVEALAHG